jgi:hypothetical protein
MRAIVTLFAAIAMTIGSMAFAADAEATRPVVGYNYPDVCKNIPGKQPVYMLYDGGPYRFVNRAARTCRTR